MGILLAGRLLQGIGGGLLTSLAYGFIRRDFPAELRTRGIAMLSGLWGVAALSGPFVGGMLASIGAWRWAFWMDVPFAAFVALLVHRVLPAHANDGPVRRFDSVSQLTLLGLSALPIAWGGAAANAGHAAAGTMIGLAIFAFMMLRERQAVRSGAPHLLPTGAFDPRSDLGAVTLTMALMGGCLSAILFLPLIASRAYGFPPLARGYFGGVMAISWTLAALATASVTRPRTRRRIIIFGPLLMLTGLCAEAAALANDSLSMMMFAMIPLGAGIGGAWAHLGTLLMETALPAERDLASACITTMQLIAGAIGSAVAGTIANLAGLAAAAMSGETTAITRAAVWLFLFFALIPAIGTLTASRAVKHAWR
jgi:MFS family permease